VVVTTTPKLTISTQPAHTVTVHKPGEVSPLPSRALHTSPLASALEPTAAGPAAEVVLRKHAKQSLSQPTIPEEGPEHSEESESGPAPIPATFSLSASVLRPKPELRVVKSLAQELTGAISKEVTSSLKKSASFKEEKAAEPAKQPMPSQPPPPPALAETTKSPKSTRQESVERLFKAIRGSSRLDSKSKKRETSLSPSGQPASTAEAAATSSSSSATPAAASGKASKKEAAKKNAQEKRDIFKSLH
jgi:hypothetical protein